MSLSRFLAVLAFGALVYAQAPSRPNAPADNPSQKPSAEAERERSGADPLLDLPPLPEGKLTLIGGTVEKLDRVRDHIAVRAFGGREIKVIFDLRTKIYRDGAPATLYDIRPGDRVYLDTLLNGDQVFARNIRIDTKPNQGDARGQVVDFNSSHGILTLREEVSPAPLKLRITPQTKVEMEKHTASLADLRPGSLVVINFGPSSDNVDVAREVHILAAPGATFTFFGKITFVDLRLQQIAIANQSDNETYDIQIDLIPRGMTRDLRVGSEATVSAVFNGNGYQARTIDVTPPSAKQQPDN